MACFTTVTSPSRHLEKEFANGHTAGSISLGGKARSGKGGKRAAPHSKVL